MTSGIPDAIHLVHGEYLSRTGAADAVELDAWGGAPSPFEFDIDPVPHGTGSHAVR